MTDDVVDGNANAFRKAFKVQATGMRSVTCDKFVRRVVERQSVHAFADKFAHQVKRARVYDRRPFDAFNVRRVVD